MSERFEQGAPYAPSQESEPPHPREEALRSVISTIDTLAPSIEEAVTLDPQVETSGTLVEFDPRKNPEIRSVAGSQLLRAKVHEILLEAREKKDSPYEEEYLSLAMDYIAGIEQQAKVVSDILARKERYPEVEKLVTSLREAERTIEELGATPRPPFQQKKAA